METKRDNRIGKYGFWVSLLATVVLGCLVIFQSLPQKMSNAEGIGFLITLVVAIGGFLAGLVGLIWQPRFYSLIVIVLAAVNFLLVFTWTNSAFNF